MISALEDDIKDYQYMWERRIAETLRGGNGVNSKKFKSFSFPTAN